MKKKTKIVLSLIKKVLSIIKLLFEIIKKAYELLNWPSIFLKKHFVKAHKRSNPLFRHFRENRNPKRKI
jgi:hypothetical protein